MDSPAADITTSDITMWLDQLGEGWNGWREAKVKGTPQGDAIKGEDEDKRKERLRELLLWRGRTQIRYRLFMSQMFAYATIDNLIKVNPFVAGSIPRRKKQDVKRPIPSQSQFQAIIDNVRSQKCATHHETADFLEFEGLVGVGQAEAAELR